MQRCGKSAENKTGRCAIGGIKKRGFRPPLLLLAWFFMRDFRILSLVVFLPMKQEARESELSEDWLKQGDANCLVFWFLHEENAEKTERRKTLYFPFGSAMIRKRMATLPECRDFE